MTTTATSWPPQRLTRGRMRTLLATLGCVEVWHIGVLEAGMGQVLHGAVVLPLLGALWGLGGVSRLSRRRELFACIALLVVGMGLVTSVVGSGEPTVFWGASTAFAIGVPSLSGLGWRVASGVIAGVVSLSLAMHWAGGQLAAAWIPHATLVGCGLLGAAGAWDRERRDARRSSELRRLQAREEHLIRRTRTDPLTGLSNRVYVQEWLQQVWERAANRGCVSVLVIDIDHFKRINDAWGHPVGDVVIREVARALERGSGPMDLVGRWGGEEFVVVLFECPSQQVWEVAEALRCAVEGRTISPLDGGPQVRATVSVGAATWNGRSDMTPQELIALADRALYKAKETGRNRVYYEAR